MARDPLTDHPAKFSEPILDRLRQAVKAEQRRLGRPPWVLDPFAGVGRVHQLGPATTIGVEIQKRWADCHRRTMWGNSLHLPFEPGTFDVIATSPCYGNRFADHFTPTGLCRPCKGTGLVPRFGGPDGPCEPCKGTGKRDHHRRSYRFVYGEDLHPDSAATLQWGPAYRSFHRQAWPGIVDALAPGGLFLLNVSDHIRDRRYRHVVAFHALELGRCGLEWEDDWAIDTDRMTEGENAEARADHEVVLALRKPAAPAIDADDQGTVMATVAEGFVPYCTVHLRPQPCCTRTMT